VASSRAEPNGGEEPGPEESARALKGLRVAELGSGFGSGYAAKLLADLGAEVIKIEPLTGDPFRRRGPLLEGSNTSALFTYLSTSKKSVTIDYDAPRGRELIALTCRTCDAAIIDVDSLGALESELGPAALVRAAPSLVAVGLRDLPEQGPYAKGSDLHAQALTGLCHQMGSPERHPLYWPYGQGGYQAGLVACIALLGALYGDRQPGSGLSTRIDVSTLKVFGALMQGLGAHVYRYFQTVPGRHGARAVMRKYPSGLFPCKDGLVALHCADDVMWERLGEMMGDPAWVHDPVFDDRLRVAQESPELGDAHLLPWLATRSREELFAEALQRRLALAPVFSNVEVAESAQLEARHFWREVVDGAGRRIRFPGPPYRLSQTPSRPGRSPELGRHTQPVLEELLGHDRRETEDLREAGIV
jgi:crotonobetainyl-CoA:carnitine CoA-transferase CaiB-like acyl-CoA transferase